MSERTLALEDAILQPQDDLAKKQRLALMVGVGGAAAAAVGYFLQPADQAFVTFSRTYLVANLLWLGVAAGLLALGMINHLSGGVWGALMRRVFEAAGRTIPVFFLLLLPFLYFGGIDALYPWANPEIVANDSLIRHKTPYLNTNFFLLRVFIYLAFLSAFGFMLSRLSHRHDETGDEAPYIAMKRLSALGMILFILLGTLASVDFIMSQDPHWFSSLFGAAWAAGQALSAFAFMIPMMIFLMNRKPLEGLITKKQFHDYGKFMLAFVMVWAYFTLSQYLIIWSGNLPEEILWYIHRNEHGWKLISVLLVVGHFFLPFALLLSQDLKKVPRLLMVVAFWVLLMRWLDLYWQTAPNYSHDHVAFAPLLDLGLPVAIGGLWVSLLFGQLKKKPIVPINEPDFKEVYAHA
ncbi:MAG: hypothetical protein AAF772_09295 [Acidobacteriota bacterium]